MRCHLLKLRIMKRCLKKENIKNFYNAGWSTAFIANNLINPQGTISTTHPIGTAQAPPPIAP